MNSKPQVLTWLTCDGVHIDPATGKHTILGVFSNIRGRNFPLKHPFMVWFLTLSDVPEGEHKIRISMGLDPTNMQQLIERPFESKGRLQRINLINEVRNLGFNEPGNYGIIVEIDEDPLLATNLQISQ
ncbi:MAG: hypothetical protein SynsKO_06090 [Synoicihabitans sp.]